MDNPGVLADERSAALVAFLFLQTDSEDLNYSQELSSKGRDLVAKRDINHNGHTEDSGELEADGHLPVNNISGCLEDVLPLVELHFAGGLEEVANVQAVAQELREIAAQFQLQMVARAAENLSRNLSESPAKLRSLLVEEVERLMRQGCLKDLPRERVLVALTLTLVKGVCIQAPQLLRTLFDTAVQFISQRWAT